jgi:hypothetical protein
MSKVMKTLYPNYSLSPTMAFTQNFPERKMYIYARMSMGLDEITPWGMGLPLYFSSNEINHHFTVVI